MVSSFFYSCPIATLTQAVWNSWVRICSPWGKKASNNVTRNVSDSFAILRHYVEAYLKSFTTNKKMVDYIIFPMAGLRKTVVNTCLLCSAWRYSLSPFYVTRMCKNSLTRSTSLLVKFASFLVILILGVSRGFNFESVIQRNRAGPNVYIGPAAVEGKCGLKWACGSEWIAF